MRPILSTTRSVTAAGKSPNAAALRSPFGPSRRLAASALWMAVGLVATLTPAPRAISAEVDPLVLEAQAERARVVKQISVTALAIFSPGGDGGGSGVVISPDGYALSNFHVTSECGNAMKCGMADGKIYDAVIVGLDPTGDVALLKLVGRDDFPFATLGDSERTRVGDWCYVVGNPFLLADDFRPTVTYGVISGVERYQYPAGTLLEYTDCLQADAAINPGNSGGPMFDASGNLIGINGRGSFEKRGRVNVGVGYAISINQIKNFMGHLRSGRVVDHATLGATVSSDEQHRVVIDDILEESDAYRRGLRYGDQIVRFANRSIATPNAFKNVLGIFPKGWRVPVVYGRKGTLHETFVRLRGVHSEAEVAQFSGRAPEPPQKHEPKDRSPQPPGSRKPAEPPPGGPRLPQMPRPGKPEPMPEAIRKQFTPRRGYANYFFNKQNQERIASALAGSGLSAGRADRWVLDGRQTDGHKVRIELSSARATLEVAGEKARIELGNNLSESLDPPGSGGLLVALSCWRRLLLVGPERFGQAYYLGTEPIPHRRGLYDVLVGTYANVQCHFLFGLSDGRMTAVETFTDDDTDPCELHLSDYREAQGSILPHRIEVRHSDAVYQVYSLDQIKFEPDR